MAKKQTRRSISVSRTTYERLKAFCETNNVSMSQFVETRVGDFLGDSPPPAARSDIARPLTVTSPPPRPVGQVSAAPVTPHAPAARPSHVPTAPAIAPVRSAAPATPASPTTSLAAAARAALEPRVVIASVSTERTENPKPPTPRTADQIFTF